MPASEKTASETLADRAYNAIADAIVCGELAAGARISEALLAKRFQIGRGPLREALRRLEGRRLVMVKPNAGARVVSLSTRDVIELFEIREILESRACQLATERMLDSEIDALEALLDTHDNDHESGRATSRTAKAPDFHTAIVRGSKSNQLISLLCSELRDLLRIYRVKSSGEVGRTEAAFREHREIVQAMRERDAERAAFLMGRHIRKARSNLLRLEGITSLIMSEAEMEDQAKTEPRARKKAPRPS
jgi:DNA-binding GntR family transcriptional regulator